MTKPIRPDHIISRLDHDALYEVLRCRDLRFDGRIFVAVRTTGVYCRPICTARLPKSENCTFYPLAALAEKHGYRPCLICRPELAPGETLLGGSIRLEPGAELAQKIVRRIEDGALNDCTVEELAKEFEITDRYLRVIFERYVGVSPIELAQTRRLLQAKQMLSETNLAITVIAYAAGFSSLRQFNNVFRKKYQMAPRDLRRSTKSVAKRSTQIEHVCQQLRLDYRPPLNWPALMNFLGMRAILGVEHVDKGTYLRTVTVGEHSGWIKVNCIDMHAAAKTKPAPNTLTVSISDSLAPVIMQVMSKIRGVFDVRANVFEIESTLSKDKVLAKTVKKYSGMRLPGAFDGFELLLRAILGQQISVKGATTLAGRFAARFGDPIQTPYPELMYTTPCVQRLAEAKVTDIQVMGLPSKRAQTIKFAATAVCEGKLNLEPGADPDSTAANLIEIPGIGEWTADYVAMRALDWPDAFPSGDLGVKKALDLTRRKDILARAECWRPWRAYATMYLWLSLADT